MSDTNKHFNFNLDRKLKSWLKFEPNFLTWLPNDKLEKTTMYLLFSLFIKFSVIEIRWVFSHAELMTRSLQWLEKEVGCRCSLVSYSHFWTDRAQYPDISAMFSVRACTRARSSTFKDLDFEVSLSSLFINWCYNHGIKKLPNNW